VEARGKEQLPQTALQDHPEGPPGGPDAGIIDSNNLSTHLDYSGYNHFTQEHIKRALAQTTLSDRTWTAAMIKRRGPTLVVVVRTNTHVWTTSLPTKRTLSPTVMPPR
jgi:hypothetical protein